MVSADNLRAALEAYTDFAKRLAAGEDSDFEELCREKRGMEAELRELHGVFQLARSLTQNRSIQERQKMN